MNTQIIKSTPKGQITLPKKWRSKFKTDIFVLEINAGNIQIKPIDVSELAVSEEVLFDARRDNAGKGISPDTMISLLKKIQRERN